MEKLIILRIFLYFPLVGFVLPDAGIWLSGAPSAIPFAHLVIVAVLIAFIAFCSVMVSIIKKRENHMDEADKGSALRFNHH
jgi:hypothetical protein